MRNDFILLKFCLKNLAYLSIVKYDGIFITKNSHSHNSKNLCRRPGQKNYPIELQLTHHILLGCLATNRKK